MVDVPRKGVARKKKIKRTIYAILTVIVLGAVTWGLSQLEPAAPSVDRASLYIDEVERGPMVIQVRGAGTLVPEEVRWISGSLSRPSHH